MSNELLIGSHINVEGEEMLLGAVKRALAFKENAFMIYTGAPQNTLRKPISLFKVPEAKQLMKDNCLDINNLIVHAPYIINLANVKDAENFPVRFLKQEIKRVAEIGAKYLVLHAGSHVGKGREIGLQDIVTNLDLTFENDDSPVIILIESMSGKGSELGSSIADLKFILDHVKRKDKLAVCLDTCHLNDAGYDLTNFDAFLDDFDTNIGIDKIKVMHLNDSKNVRGSNKDRHENFGFGELGFDNLINIIYNPRLQGVIYILETPWVDGIAPYKQEIEMIRSKHFNPRMKEELLANKDM